MSGLIDNRKKAKEHFYAKWGYYATAVALLITVLLTFIKVPESLQIKLEKIKVPVPPGNEGPYLIVILILIIFFVGFVIRRRNLEKNKILLFYPRWNRDISGFWSQFIDLVIETINEKSKYQIRPCPIDIYGSDVDKIVESFKKNTEKKDCIGIIISSPNNNDTKLVDVIVNLVRNGTKIVLHDIPHTSKISSNEAGKTLINEFLNEKLILPSIISVDNKRGGVMAAEILHEQLTNSGIVHPNKIYVLHGNMHHQHSILRVEGFTEKIRELTNRRLSVTPFPFDGNWSRTDAKIEFDSWLNRIESSISNEKIDGIFACNDDMALGICDSILEIQNEKLSNIFGQTLIVGFDNTKELALAWKNNKKIVGTIDANIKLQAERTSLAILHLIKNGDKSPQFDEPIAPEPIKYKET